MPRQGRKDVTPPGNLLQETKGKVRDLWRALRSHTGLDKGMNGYG